jgi:hypothetical protein
MTGKDYFNAEILRHKKQGHFILSFLARDPQRGGWRQAGKPIRVEALEFERRGLDLIFQALQKLEKEPVTLAAREDQLGPKEIREYLWVDLKYYPREAIEIMPMHREAGGHVGDPAEAVRLDFPVTQESFWQTLNDAFDEC